MGSPLGIDGFVQSAFMSSSDNGSVWQNDSRNSAESHAPAAISRVQQRLSIFPGGRDGVARRVSQLLLVPGCEFAYNQMPGSVVTPTEGQSLAIRGHRWIPRGMRKLGQGYDFSRGMSYQE